MPRGFGATALPARGTYAVVVATVAKALAGMALSQGEVESGPPSARSPAVGSEHEGGAAVGEAFEQGEARVVLLLVG
jgi:hypothetical protein